jgi:hypothetical protein
LSKTPSGRELIKLYYQVSPMLVEMLEDDELLRESFIRFYYEWGPALLEAIEEDEAFRSEIKEMIDGVLPLIREIVE